MAIRRTSVVASHAFFLTDSFTFNVSAGGQVTGQIEGPTSGVYDLGAGWLAAGAGSFRVLDGSGAPPFILIGLAFAASRSTIRPENGQGDGTITALDARVSLTVGKTLWQTLTPYLSVRAFGGPVNWNDSEGDRTGSDIYHYAPAAGLIATLPAGFDLFAEGSPLGERSLAGGLGYRY